MEKTFAGFWRDGAKVLPEYRHADATGYVIRFSKSKKEFSCCHAMRPSVWSEFYWLDTTTPEELTPQEAFELLKVVFPMITGIEKDSGIEKDRQRDYTMKGYRYTEANINWGDTTEYSPKQKWRVPTDADKGKKCRFKDTDREWNQSDDGYLGTFLCTTKDKFIIETTCGVSRWFYCEVLDE